MSAVHSVTVTVDEDGDAYHWSFACSGTAADVCHQWCAEGCEEICYGEEIILSGADVEPIAQAPLAGHRWEPMPPHGESCRIVDWLDAGDSREDYLGEDEGDGPPNRSGVIEEEWDGDGYLWRYAGPTEPGTPGAPVVSADQLLIPVDTP